jgi:type I restriction enzyme M protein
MGKKPVFIKYRVFTGFSFWHYLALAVEKSAIKPAIYGHCEFAAFITGMNAHFDQWRQSCSGNAKPQLGTVDAGNTAELVLGAPKSDSISGNAKHQLGDVDKLIDAELVLSVPCVVNLKSLQPGFHPKELIASLSEDLLAHYLGKPLIDQYDVYQHMMDYWAETMQDDCYLIAADGWKAETYRIVEKDKKGKEKDKGWTCDLVPKALIVARYFAKEQEAIDRQASELESIAAQITELEEEHSGEDAPFSGFDKINKASIAARLKEVRAEIEELKPGEGEWVMEEKRVLEEWLKLNDEEAGLKKRLKEAEAELDKWAYAHYPKLTEDEIKTLVVDDKWLAALDAMIHGEMDRISQMLTQRVKELAELYETPMPQLSSRAADWEAKVYRHLEKMGFSLS